MSIIAGKYTYKRRLGGGTYGDVQLVFDKNGRELALKMISKKMISQQPYLEEYIEGEKQCMISVKGPYTVELYEVIEDSDYIYFACEYCNGGDLLSYQAKQPNKVFDLKQATKIMSQIILGLQLLHRTGYLHRDIKPQNILVKKDENGSVYFKLADFGFAKKIENSTGTVLGTENYMSPQIYSNDYYGFEVDMWAFGVLFYFMLNMEMPFSFNAHTLPQVKRQQLTNDAKNFSYQKKVESTKKKITKNCTPEIQDLFSRIFEVDTKKRINFAKIRSHPVFKEYFPNVSEESSKIYLQKPKNRYADFMQEKRSGIKKHGMPLHQSKQDPLQIHPSVFLKKPKTSEQREVIELQLEKIKFLGQSGSQLCSKLGFIDPNELLAFSYNVLTYKVILLKNFLQQLNPKCYAEKYPDLKWDKFFQSEGDSMKQTVEQELSQAEIQVSQAYDSCRKNWNQIKKFNPKLEAILEPEVSEKSFSKKLKESYRGSTSGLFTKLREKMNISNTYAYYTLLVFLTHAYNNIIITEDEDLHELFSQFVKQKKLENKIINFRELRSWLTNQSKETLKSLIVSLNKTYFPNS